MELEVYQFISRKNIENQSLGIINTSPRQRDDLKFSIEFEIIDKPFEVNFTQLSPSRPSIGAHQYIDPYIDVYMKERWPKCIKGSAKLEISKSDQADNEILKMVLLYMRVVCWHLKNHVPVLKEYIDQFSTQKAYRREYLGHQMYDICGNRRPSSAEKYYLTEIGEYIGPGVVSILNQRSHNNINEYVWSQLIAIKNPTDIADDLPKIREQLSKMRTHHNTYNELSDARRLLSNGELKSAVRSAASSVDAILRYHCNLWEVSYPTMRIQFDEKIERILNDADKPSYKSVDANNSELLLFLYRARNSMHEGDCYYKNNSGDTININNKDQVLEFVNAVEDFTLWIDSLV